jgi:hypothetical protein
LAHLAFPAERSALGLIVARLVPYAIRAVSDMNILLFAKDRKCSLRERTYVTEGRITEHATGEEGLGLLTYLIILGLLR